MSSSARVCLIADGYLSDFANCLNSILNSTDSLISILVNGKQKTSELEIFSNNQQIKRVDLKNPLGWGNAINYFIEQESEDFLVIMDPSTIFISDPISKSLESFNSEIAAVGWKGGLIDVADEWRSVKDVGSGEVDVLFSYFIVFDRKFAKSVGGANPSAKYYRNADLEFSLKLRAAGKKIFQLDLPLKQERHHGYHDVDSEYRDKNSRKNYQRILDNYRGRTEILSPRR